MNDNPRFSAHVRTQPGERPEQTVFLSGELDVAACTTLRRATSEIGDCDLVVNLERVSFIDAAGLGCLIALHTDLLSRNRTATLRGAAARVARVFAIVGLSGLLETPPLPHPTGSQPARAAKATSGQTQPEHVTRRSRSGRLSWQSPTFAIVARVTYEPRGVHVTATGDFSTPASAAVLHGAIARLARFQAPIEINDLNVTNMTGPTARVFHTYSTGRHLDPESVISGPSAQASLTPPHTNQAA